MMHVLSLTLDCISSWIQQILLNCLLELGTKCVEISLINGSTKQHLLNVVQKNNLSLWFVYYLLIVVFIPISIYYSYNLPMNHRLTQITAFLSSPPQCPIDILSSHFQTRHLLMHLKLYFLILFISNKGSSFFSGAQAEISEAFTNFFLFLISKLFKTMLILEAYYLAYISPFSFPPNSLV